LRTPACVHPFADAAAAAYRYGGALFAVRSLRRQAM